MKQRKESVEKSVSSSDDQNSLVINRKMRFIWSILPLKVCLHTLDTTAIHYEPGFRKQIKDVLQFG